MCCHICRAAKDNKYLDPCYKHLFIELILFFANIKAEVMRGVKEGEGTTRQTVGNSAQDVQALHCREGE